MIVFIGLFHIYDIIFEFIFIINICYQLVLIINYNRFWKPWMIFMDVIGLVFICMRLCLDFGQIGEFRLVLMMNMNCLFIDSILHDGSELMFGCVSVYLLIMHLFLYVSFVFWCYFFDVIDDIWCYVMIFDLYYDFLMLFINKDFG